MIPVDICPEHGVILRTTSGRIYCYRCEEELANNPLPEEMTGDERVVEMRRWMEQPACTDPDKLLQRVETLVGRPIPPLEYVHGWDDLLEEARNRFVGE